MNTKPDDMNQRRHILVDPPESAAQDFHSLPKIKGATARPGSMPRRRFLARLVLVVPVATTGVVGTRLPVWAAGFAGNDGPVGKQKIRLDMLTCDVFTECLGSKFSLKVESGKSVEVELIEATPLASRPQIAGLAKRDPFSIVFRAPRDFVVPQKIYELRHDKVGTLEIFLVPIGPDEHGMRYEAIFN